MNSKISSILSSGAKSSWHAAINVMPHDVMSLYPAPAGAIWTNNEMQAYLRRPTIRMVSGLGFNIGPSEFENEYTQQALKKKQTRNLSKLAQLEHLALVAIYRHNGHHVFVEPPPPAPDPLIFPHPANDSIFATDQTKTQRWASKLPDGSWQLGPIMAMLPKYQHELRQYETIRARDSLETTFKNPDKNAHIKILQKEFIGEFGDTRFIAGRNMVLAGLTERTKTTYGRSTIEGHNELREMLRQHVSPCIDVYTIGLVQPYYHLDTAQIPTADGRIFTNQKAYTKKGWGLMRELFSKDDLIEIPEIDLGLRFGGNATNFAENIQISNRCSNYTARIFTERGFNIFKTPIDATYQGGGGQRCMTDVFPEIFLEGGYKLEALPHEGSIYEVKVDLKTTRIYLYNDKGDRKDITTLARDFMPETSISR